MPYIVKEDKQMFDGALMQLTGTFKELILADNHDKRKLTGFMNYCITRLIWHFIKFTGERYDSYNDAMGILECVKLELARRKLALYEEEKQYSNGDVYYEYPGKAAMERGGIVEDICRVVDSVGRPYIASQIRSGQATAHTILTFLLAETHWSAQDREKLEQSRDRAYRVGV